MGGAVRPPLCSRLVPLTPRLGTLSLAESTVTLCVFSAIVLTFKASERKKKRRAVSVISYASIVAWLVEIPIGTTCITSIRNQYRSLWGFHIVSTFVSSSLLASRYGATVFALSVYHCLLSLSTSRASFNGSAAPPLVSELPCLRRFCQSRPSDIVSAGAVSAASRVRVTLSRLSVPAGGRGKSDLPARPGDQ